MSAIEIPIWHGTLEQSYQLEAAIQNNCDCLHAKRRCSAHEAMLEQRFVDGVLFARFLRTRLIGEEQCR
jgi:hypothetical protein